MDAVRGELEERFARAAGGRDLALPPVLRESMVGAARLDGGGCPEALARYYCQTMPSLRVDQLEARGRAAELLVRPVDLKRSPRLRSAIDGVYAALAAEGL